MRRIPLLLVLGSLISGCQGYQLALTSSGPTQDRTQSMSQINVFRAAFELASRTVPGPDSNGQATGATVAGADAIAANTVYLNSGFALANINCLDYFRRAGRLQQAANVFKDLNNSFIPILAGGLALAANSAKTGAILSLVAASNNAALSAVYSDFLFDATNIDDVQQLTTNALAIHEEQVRKNITDPSTAINFNWTTDQIVAHQALCQPTHILSLVRQSIANSTLTARNSGSNASIVQNTSSGDSNTRAMVGNVSTAPLPPPPSRVEVTVVPRGSITPDIVTIPAGPDPNRRVLARCIWPTAVRFERTGPPTTAGGAIAPASRSVLIPLLVWLKQQHIETLTALLFGEQYATARVEALNRFCNN